MTSTEHRAPTPGLTGTAPPGWYHDPWQRYPQRWWTGIGWSPYARQGQAQYLDLPPDEFAHLHYVEEFLDQARTDQAISPDTYRVLLTRVANREQALAGAVPLAGPTAIPAGAPAQPVAPQGPVPSAKVPVPSAKVPVPSAQAAVPPNPQAPVLRARQPGAPAEGAVSGRMRVVRGAVRSDLAVHGLAYLGVILLFAGLFGLVAFSFSSVRVGFRPVAEVVVPAAVLGSAWLLARRKLVVPARALVVLGGLLLLVVVLAAFVDGAPVPPDPSGIALVAALTVAPAALAVAYGLWARHHLASPLRLLAAPALWLAVAMAALGWSEPVPGGRDIAIPRPGQLAAVLVAIAVTLAASRLRLARPLASWLFPAGLVGLGIAVVLEGLAAGFAGWPVVPVAVCGAAALAVLELSASKIPGAPRVVLQAAVVALTGIALIPGLGAGWAAASASVAGLAVVEAGLRRGVPRLALLVPVVVSAAGLVVAAWVAPALLVAGTVGAGWAHARRLWPGRWPYPVVLLSVTAAVTPVGVLAGLLGTLPVDLGTGLAGLLVLCFGVGVRLLARPQDRFWTWWMPVAGAAILVATASQGATAWVVVAATAGSLAVAVSPARTALRVWVTAAGALWAAWLGLEVTGLGMQDRLLGVAGVALAAVAFAALRGGGMVAGHVGSFGHLAGLAFWPFAAVEAGTVNAATPTAVLGLAVAAASITAVAQEAGRTAVPDLLAQAGSRISRGLSLSRRDATEVALRQVPTMVAAVALVPFVAWLPALTGLAVPHPWEPLPVSALGLCYVLATWALRPWRRLAQVLADVGPWTATAAAVACEHRAPALAALAVVMATPLLAAPELRRRATAWVAWAATVPFAVLAARLLWLPASYWYAVVLGWGAVLLVGGLAGDEILAGRRGSHGRVRTWWLLPAVVVGAGSTVAGLVGSASGSASQSGWALIAGATVAMVCGVLLRTGLLGGVGAALAIVGADAVVPWRLSDRPWLLLDVAAVLLIAAEVTRPRGGAKVVLWRRWDLSLFVVAHGTVLAALALALASGSEVPVTLVGSGGLALAVGGRQRRWPWAIGGAALVLTGAAVAGAGWAALAFAGVAILATALAGTHQGRLRRFLQLGGALAAAGSWMATLVWWDTTFAAAVEATCVAAGIMVLLAAAAARVSGAARDWSAVWGGLAIALTLWAAAGLAWPAMPPAAGFYVAGALAATAVGCGLAAEPLRLFWLRHVAALSAVGAAAASAQGTSVDFAVLTWGATAAGILACGVILGMRTRRVAAQWVGPGSIVAVAATVAAFAGSALTLPDRALLVPAFVLAAVMTVTFAEVLGRPALRCASPALLCAAWLAYASVALAGQPQWYTLPAGAAMLAVAGLLRSARRASGRPVGTPDVIGLEVAGMVMVMAASLVQGFTRGPLYDLAGAGLALALAGWGALTRVRRRLLGGAVAFALSLLLLVAVPLVAAVPQWSGVAGWLILAAVGLVAIAAAALLDAARAAVRRGAARLADLTKGWE